MMLALALSLAAAAAQGSDPRTTVRAYVFTETRPGSERTADGPLRAEAVRDVKDALARKKGIQVVDDRADATLLVEIVGAERKEDVQGPFGGKALTPLGDTIIRMHVSSGGQESDLKGMGPGTLGRAARDAADRVMKWIARREPPRAVKGPRSGTGATGSADTGRGRRPPARP